MIECSALIPVRDFDLRIDALEAQIKEFRDRVSRMALDIDSEKNLYRKKEALLQKIQLRRRKNEKDFEELNETEKATELRLKSAGLAPASYAALEKELAVIREKASQLETAVLEDMEKLEILEKDLEKGNKLIAGRDRHLEEIRGKMKDDVKKIACERDEIAAQRSQAALKTPANLLEIYENLRQRKKGCVLWDIETNGCPACGHSLPDGMLSALHSGTAAHQCPNCEILLRWTGLRDEL